MSVSEDGQEETLLREAGVAEGGRLRKNGFSYFDSHGLGLASSGINEMRGA